jgi:hypothetical protein
MEGQQALGTQQRTGMDGNDGLGRARRLVQVAAERVDVALERRDRPGLRCRRPQAVVARRENGPVFAGAPIGRARPADRVAPNERPRFREVDDAAGDAQVPS